MSGRVLIHVQHLLGVGHLMRAARLASAAAAAGLETTLVSGGPPVPHLDPGRARLVQLPPMRADDESFASLVDGDGRPIDDAWRARRRDRLLELFAASRPDVLVTELFPFGRRQCRFELLPLLDAARRMRPRPAVACSVRDILQAGRKPGRTQESAALVRDRYDTVLVHGDPRLIRFEETFPLAAEIEDWLAYTGYVAPPAPPAGGADSGEVVVSAGGGAVGAALLRAAAAARPLSALAQRTWRLLVGGDQGLAAELRRDPGLVVEPARPDFTRLLATAAVSVSQAGYNTAMDVLAARARAVFVPFVGAGENEQSLRAARLADRLGGIEIVAEARLTAARLAAAIDRAAAGPRPDPDRMGAHGLDLSGAETTARMLDAVAAERRRPAVNAAGAP